jgi:hypothetical protein
LTIFPSPLPKKNLKKILEKPSTTIEIFHYFV